MHSIELLFDPDTEAAIRRIWDDLAAAGLPSQAAHRSPSNRPHVTLAVAESIAPAVDDLLAGVAARLPLRCVVGAPLLFGWWKAVLARLLVPSAELIADAGRGGAHRLWSTCVPARSSTRFREPGHRTSRCADDWLRPMSLRPWT